MSTPPRPSIYNLQRFLLGTLPPAEAAQVAAWVESSPDAPKALAAVAAQDALTKAVTSTVGVNAPPAPVVDQVAKNAAAAAARPVPRPATPPVPPPVQPSTPGLPDVAQQTRPSSAPRQASTGEWQPAPGAAPARLGPFRIVRELGRGGMAVVFEAVDEALGRRAAVKVLAPHLAKNDEARRRFLWEGRMAADLKSDHVVTIYQVGEDGGTPFLAMELIEGPSLETWLLTRQAPITATEMLWVARNLLDGLALAHKKGRFHRDIKPANAMVERETQRVKILDFGLTRVTDDGESLTRTGAVLGTPTYMSPEQARGEKVDARTDLFSVGVVLYRMVLGRSPFQRDGLMPTLYAVVHEPPPLLTGLPSELSAFVARLMAPNRDDRPVDAGAALAELKALETRLSAASAPQPATYQPTVKTPTTARPKPPPVPTVSTTSSAPTAAPRKRSRALFAVGGAAIVALVGAVIVLAGGKGSKDGPRSDNPGGDSVTGVPGAPGGPRSTEGGGARFTELPALTPGATVATAGDILRGEMSEATKIPGAYTYTAQYGDGRRVGFNTSYTVTYSVSVAVSLKSGQKLAVTASTVGKERNVLLVLIDPTGTAVDGTEPRPRTAAVTFHEVSATGKYHIIVASDRIGDFFLRISDPATSPSDAASLEEELARMKRELAEAEASLKALKGP